MTSSRSTFSTETFTCTPRMPKVSRYADLKFRWCMTLEDGSQPRTSNATHVSCLMGHGMVPQHYNDGYCPRLYVAKGGMESIPALGLTN